MSVVVPVYRNAETLEELWRRACAALEPGAASIEFVFVCDACPEGSLPVLHELARRDPRVAVVPLAANVGQHRAVLRGLARARGSTVVVLDADLQDPPEAIPELLRHLRGPVAAVFAGRRGRYESPLRLATSRVFKHLLHLTTGVPRDAGMFVAMTRELAERLVLAEEPHPFVVAMIGRTGLPCVSVPVRRARRPHGRSAYSARARLAIGLRTVLGTLRRRPSPGPASGASVPPVPPARSPEDPSPLSAG